MGSIFCHLSSVYFYQYPFLFVFQLNNVWCLFLGGYGCARVCAYVYVVAGGRLWVYFSITLHLILWNQSLSQDLKLTDKGRLSIQ